MTISEAENAINHIPHTPQECIHTDRGGTWSRYNDDARYVLARDEHLSPTEIDTRAESFPPSDGLSFSVYATKCSRSTLANIRFALLSNQGIIYKEETSGKTVFFLATFTN
jgi:hypothetical protein